MTQFINQGNWTDANQNTGQNIRPDQGVLMLWNKYRYVILVMLLGVILLLWGGGTLSGSGKTQAETYSTENYSLGSYSPESYNPELFTRNLQEEMAEILSQMSGVGQTRVLLTLDTDGERYLAQNTELTYSGNLSSPEKYAKTSRTVLVDGDSGEQSLVTGIRQPTWRGALIVCRGGDSPEVKLMITQAVTALTGLSADRVTVAKWQ